MPPAREKMRPWLVKQINSNTVPGLCWIDKEKTMFSVPWKHAARHGYEMNKDACLFQKWAVHTGKYRVGQKCDPKTWKANFRCAVHSLPDVVEVKDRGIQKGHEAMRVFKMLPESHGTRGKQTKPRHTKYKRTIKIEETDSDDEESSNSTFERSPSELAPTQESTVDSTVDSEQQDLTIEEEVPEWSQMVEIAEPNFHLQVSPEQRPDSSDYDFSNVTIKIIRPLEKDAHWSSLDGQGGPTNELCTSPGSQWSETSSGEDLDEPPLYTTLSPSLLLPNEMWSTSLPQTIFSFHETSP